jgi:hypothetical protein
MEACRRKHGLAPSTFLTHLFKKAGPCVIQVKNDTGGLYSLKLRPWNLLDYATISFYKSTC